MFEDNTFESLLEEKLDMVPNTLDKREGSIMYNALAPNAAETAKIYLNLALSEDRFFADTATGEDLTRRCAERGVFRKLASRAIRKGLFKNSEGCFIDIPIGSKFRADDVVFDVTKVIDIGVYELTCEATGTIGNYSLGDMIPVDYIKDLATAELLDILIPGEDEETDESLRKRYYDNLDTQAFGGNIADYKEKINAIPGVGGVKVYPVWNGGGTVKLTIIDSTYEKPSGTLINTVQTLIDPVTNHGEGLGIAPIGHFVTVDGVENEEISVECKFIFENGYTFDNLKNTIISIIEDYFKELSKKWSDTENTVIRVSQIESRLLNVTGIVDVQNTQINNEPQNFVLNEHFIPKLKLVGGL